MNLQENIGTIALRNLRIEKFKMGFPFMINSPELPEYQCYFEYPDGSILLVKLDESKKDFIDIKKLTDEERIKLLLDNNLLL